MTVTPLEHDQDRASHQLELEHHLAEQDDLQAALVAALGELSNIPKDGTADAGSYRYSFATLAATLSSSRPILAKHGLALTQKVTTDLESRTVTISTLILHTGGGRFDAGKITFPLGQTTQATGSVISYARRYAIQPALGITGLDDDDDAQTVTAPTSRPQPRMIASVQMKRIGALMDDAGINRDDNSRRQLVAGIVGRTIKTRNELTAVEATSVIDALQAIVDGSATAEITDDGEWRIIATDTGEYVQ